MNALESALRGIVTDLSSQRRKFALIRGLAVSIRTQPRSTQDADLAVSVGSDAEAEQIVADLRRSGYEITAMIEQVETGRLGTVRLRPDSSSMIVDLLFASTGIEPEIVAGASVVEVLPGLRVPVASVGPLIAMKLPSVNDRRARDHGDWLRSPTRRRGPIGSLPGSS